MFPVDGEYIGGWANGVGVNIDAYDYVVITGEISLGINGDDRYCLGC